MNAKPSGYRGLLHRFVPGHFEDPVGLARRLIASGDPAARFAMATAALGLIASPLDWILGVAEAGRCRQAPPPRWPIFLVCGPARSGTTLVAQTLIQHLPVSYFTNVTAVFPRAPLTASRFFTPDPRPSGDPYRSYYGRTDSWTGPSDALPLWDRWLGSTRNRIVGELSAADAAAMRGFFGAAEAAFGKPLLNKNNSLIGAAVPVAAALPTARFICLERDPVYLAQALLIARRQIHARDAAPYGLTDPDGPEDPIDNVCHQVRFVTELGRRAAADLGPDRFRLVSYEAFCARPAELVSQCLQVLADATGVTLDVPAPEAFTASRQMRVDPAVLRRFESALGDLRNPAPTA